MFEDTIISLILGDSFPPHSHSRLLPSCRSVGCTPDYRSLGWRKPIDGLQLLVFCLEGVHFLSEVNGMLSSFVAFLPQGVKILEGGSEFLGVDEVEGVDVPEENKTEVPACFAACEDP